MIEESNLLESIKKEKTEKAFVELTDIYKEQVLNFLKNKTYGTGLDYEEVYNRTLLKVWNNISSFEERSMFKTWFFRIAKNTLFDEIKKRKRISLKEVNIENPDWLNEQNFIDFKTPESAILDQESVDEILARISKIKASLDKKHRKVFELIFEQGHSYKQAAEKLNCSVGTIMSRVFYTRKKIQETFKKYEHLQTN
jgi:RNA polymerase sigma-70 factor (ECF subfamily)